MKSINSYRKKIPIATTKIGFEFTLKHYQLNREKSTFQNKMIYFVTFFLHAWLLGSRETKNISYFYSLPFLLSIYQRYRDNESEKKIKNKNQF